MRCHFHPASHPVAEQSKSLPCPDCIQQTVSGAVYTIKCAAHATVTVPMADDGITVMHKGIIRACACFDVSCKPPQQHHLPAAGEQTQRKMNAQDGRGQQWPLFQHCVKQSPAALLDASHVVMTRAFMTMHFMAEQMRLVSRHGMDFCFCV